MKSKHSKLLLISAILVLSVMFVSCAKVTADDVSKKIASGDYSSAISDYKKIGEEDKQKLVEQFKQEVENIKTKFIKGEIDKNAATSAIDTIKTVSGMEETCNNGLTIINNLDASLAAFKAAEKLASEGKDMEAIAEYSKVIASDEANYNTAKTKIEELSNKIEASIPVKVISTGLDKDIINKQIIKIQMKNTSDKPTKEVVVTVFAYDKNGYPVKVQFGYKEYMNCKYDKTIQPNETTPSGYSWDLYNDNSQVITQVVTIVKNVTYYDGTTWENPLYTAMVTKYSGNPIK